MAAVANIENEEKLNALLIENYHYLVRHINTREFIPHLIAKQVLTVQDKEDIESKTTSIDRAGRLIDVVMMQGYKGMCEFMLIVEYDSPAAFFHIQKREAREPPKDWLQLRRNMPSMRRRRSRDSMSHLHGLISHLMTELNDQKQAVDKIMRKMKDVSQLQTETKDEQENDYKFFESQLTEMEDRYALVSDELVQSKKAYEELKAKHEEEKLENEKLLKQHMEDRERLTALQADYDTVWNEIDSLKSHRSLLRARESRDVDKLVEEVERLTALLQLSGQKPNDDEVKRLRQQLQTMAQRNAEFSVDISKAQEQRDKTFKELKKTEQSLQEQAKLVQQLKEENISSKKKSEDLELQIGQLEKDKYWLEREKTRYLSIKITPRTPTSPTAGDGKERFQTNSATIGSSSS